jgi:PBSX family phage terminase large subunit
MGPEQLYEIGAASDVFDEMMQPSRYKALYGGRGSAKSHFFAEAMIGNAASGDGFRAVCVREVQKSLKESAKRLLEDKIAAMGFSRLFSIQSDSIKTPGGGIITFQGMQDHTAESVKSLEGFNVAWCEEAQTLSTKSLEMLRPTIRTPGSEIWFSWNPRNAGDPVDAFFRGVEPPEDAIIRGINYDQNKLFPPELEVERLHDERTNPDRYAHIWLGAYEPQAVGAIWSRQVIHGNRLAEMQVERERTVVGIDPAVSDTETSDMHGISVCAMGADDRGYVLEDASLKGSPHQWAERAIAMFDKWDADAVVIEINQGGDMVKHTLQTIRRDLPIIEVRATRGKHVRAEPISALYTLGRVSHIGTFTEMEDQLCKFTSHGYEGNDSPDRAEAMIWCMTELFPDLTISSSKVLEEDYGSYGPPVEGAWMS